MNAIKLMILFFPVLIFGQTKYPKDTIYIKFEKTLENEKWYGDYGYGENRKKGVLFNLKDNNNQYMSLFAEKEQSSDTLCYNHLKEYNFYNLKEIEKKENTYYKKRFGRIPWIKNKNAVFQTYLVEIISDEKIVIYSVIWRSEGAMP